MPRAFVRAACAALLAALASLGVPPTPAAAQAASCPPPLKWAAGACVSACPGGYEDHGRECVYRRQH
jgi:hypothetical protein